MKPKARWQDLIPGDQFEMMLFNHNTGQQRPEVFTFSNWVTNNNIDGADIRICDTLGNYITRWVDDVLWRYWQKEVMAYNAQTVMSGTYTGKVKFYQQDFSDNMSDSLIYGMGNRTDKAYGEFKDFMNQQENYEGPLKCTCGVTKTMGDDPSNKHSEWCDLVTKEKSKI